MIYIMVLTFKLITCSAQANSQGVRSWIATGQKGISTIPSTLSSLSFQCKCRFLNSTSVSAITGQIYVAFFNLNDDWATITAQKSDLAKELPGTKLSTGSCKGTEAWSGQDLGIIGQTISFSVIPHGAAVIVLQCT